MGKNKLKCLESLAKNLKKPTLPSKIPLEKKMQVHYTFRPWVISFYYDRQLLPKQLVEIG